MDLTKKEPWRRRDHGNGRSFVMERVFGMESIPRTAVAGKEATITQAHARVATKILVAPAAGCYDGA